MAIGASSPGRGRKAAPTRAKERVTASIGCQYPRDLERTGPSSARFKDREGAEAYMRWKATPGR